MNYLNNIIVLLQNILENIGQGGGGGGVSPTDVKRIIDNAIIELSSGKYVDLQNLISTIKSVDPTIDTSELNKVKQKLDTLSQNVGDLSDLETEAKDTLVNAINEAATKGGGDKSVTYTIEDWKALTDEERKTAKTTYDTIYITGDVSDWCQKPTIATSYPADNVPKDNTIYNLGEKSELTITSTPENGCASISVIASADGLTLGIAEGVKVIGSIPTIEGGKEYFIGIVDGKVYVNEVSTQEGA